MARKRTPASPTEIKATDYRHKGEKRTNIPPAKIAGEGKVPVVPKVRYYYNPHLPPVLRFDSTGEADKVKEVIEEAGRRTLTAAEQTIVAEAIHHYQPWLEWADKREQEERRYFEVDPVALHIHERVSAQAIVRTAIREDTQRGLFADPQQPYKEAIQFYKHDVDWANRLILGDSLQVMGSLARRENLAGNVQMIYIDPPYGIKFSSNFQPRIGTRTVGDGDKDLTREAETVRAYRDTWELGIHSYLRYLRERLVVCHDLLAETGSVFVQINDQNVHHVRTLLHEVFGAQNFVVTVLVKKKGSQKGTLIDPVNDYVLWAVKDVEKARLRFHQFYERAAIDRDYLETFRLAELPNGETASVAELGRRQNPPANYIETPDLLFRDYPGARLFTSENATSGGVRTNQSVLFHFEGRDYDPGLARGNCWKHTAVSQNGERSGMQRVGEANRLYVGDSQLRLRRFAGDFGARATSNWWDGLGGAPDPVFVVQTNTEIVKRLMLMVTEPGDLVLDPTCGSGTTAYVAEQWGRRWVTIDTSRVAVSIARQRLLTCQFPYYKLKNEVAGPAGGIVNSTALHVTSSVVANCHYLDPIFDKHQEALDAALEICNRALKTVSSDVTRKLTAKLKAKPKRELSDADRRRWELPEKFDPWTVPFDIDPDWPKALQDAVIAYSKAWRAKMDEVNQCIADNAEPEQLVDQPEVIKGVLRVSGPFTVEGVRPEELSLGEGGLVDPTPNDFEHDGSEVEVKNINAYLIRMVQYLRSDGLTFIGNKQKKFSRLEPLFEAQTGGIIHADGVWDGGDVGGPNTVAVGFGPQYGPVTALQVEELIRASIRYDDLVVAGFSFDAEATEVIQTQAHPKLQIHQAYIRPDINPGMEGLLKDTPNSQLFTVFGQPEVEVKPTKDGEWVATLAGVDIYDPIENTVRSSGADKVAAWFLDSDYDGRCFCITQAFFPDQDAWEKIAKALGSSADAAAFDKFSGTESLPFKTGKHKRIAVKVIDPRGNEVMAVRQLEA